MSKYVNRMKNVLETFNNTALEIRSKMDFNNKNYNADYAGQENAILQARMNQAADDARRKIEELADDATAAARKWAEFDGDNIDAVDLDLLKGAFEPSAEALYALLVKHQENGVMVNAIAKYAKEHQIILDYVPNLEDKLFAYKRFAESANNVISNITGNIGLAVDGISRWAQPGNISHRMEVILYGIQNHNFDNSSVQQGSFSFDFKHLHGR